MIQAKIISVANTLRGPEISFFGGINNLAEVWKVLQVHLTCLNTESWGSCFTFYLEAVGGYFCEIE